MGGGGVTRQYCCTLISGYTDVSLLFISQIFLFIFSTVLQNMFVSDIQLHRAPPPPNTTHTPHHTTPLSLPSPFCFGVSFSLSFLLKISCKKRKSKLYGIQISWNAFLYLFVYLGEKWSLNSIFLALVSDACRHKISRVCQLFNSIHNAIDPWGNFSK